jgi:hypothetical protein
MPMFNITVVNEDFTASDEHDYPNQDTALEQAIKAAIHIATDHVAAGKPFFAAEVVIEEDSKRIARYVIGVGASRLKH